MLCPIKSGLSIIHIRIQFFDGCKWLIKVSSLAPIVLVDDIIRASTSQCVILNSLVEQFQKSKKLQFSVSKCMVLPNNSYIAT